MFLCFFLSQRFSVVSIALIFIEVIFKIGLSGKMPFYLHRITHLFSFCGLSIVLSSLLTAMSSRCCAMFRDWVSGCTMCRDWVSGCTLCWLNYVPELGEWLYSVPGLGEWLYSAPGLGEWLYYVTGLGEWLYYMPELGE